MEDKLVFVVLDDGGSLEEGVMTESDLEEVVGWETHLCMTIEELENVVRQMKEGKTDFDLSYFNGGGG
jgi:hypothetical protein